MGEIIELVDGILDLFLGLWLFLLGITMANYSRGDPLLAAGTVALLGVGWFFNCRGFLKLYRVVRRVKAEEMEGGEGGEDGD